MMKYIYAACLIQLAAFSCGSHSNGSGLQEVIGSEITLPTDLPCKVMERDTVVAPCDTLSPAKVLVYYDAQGCTPCKLKELFEWDILIRDIAATDSGCRFVYVLNITATTLSEIELSLMGCRFDHPVFLDTAGVFERLNPELPANPLFHTFLLDRENRVMLVGSPIGNPKMWELYKQTIQKLTAALGGAGDQG